jgi:lipid-A-disaccharide synthase
MKKILIIAGDNSGDLHGANLMKELLTLSSDIEFLGIGGELMMKNGLNSIVKLKDISVVGFWEVAKKALFFKKLLNKIKNIIENEGIDIFIAIDFPGFNERVAAFAKKVHKPVVWYIAPQLWAWGEKRSLKFSQLIDLLLVVFPFEVEYFQKFGINCSFVGHPLLDNQDYAGKNLNFEERENKILLMPGSRLQELRKHLPLLQDVAKISKIKFPDYRIVLAIPEYFKNEIASTINDKSIEISTNSRKELLVSKVGVIKTGTSNLEAALAGLPFVMYYKTSLLTYYLGKKLINLEYLSLINILAKKNVVKELIQSDATAGNIINEIERLLLDNEYYNNQRHEFELIKAYLGKSGTAKNAALLIYNNYLI